MKLFTIGFTKTTAENFFRRLEIAGVKRVLDVRLKTDSQLSGFAKKADLRFFLREIVEADYQHQALLAPTPDMLSAYRKGVISWDEYERKYIDLLRERHAERLDPKSFESACLLCSEDTPHKCHRRLAAEFLTKSWGEDYEIINL